MVRIIADTEACASSGMCALTAPGHFDQDDEDGRVVLLADEAEDCDDEVADAVRLCPAGALRLE
ncbi:ferredoxin [Glycomyces algeriensis]|uniref:Ferredoxin n=1 Tax=Glycomyces algeriensis TaxID=256037 RepID=A0A9W6G5T1_9ACTN|nr:ferredoxin [Glycomyces algeriensis]MDA1368430.1 ferredoxin [Glycomyces algeriensis]MDR7353236.1 ferredoxin [Glycomyces algeriensis]GLI40930.1 ferredoxin [Glycomyces algeriensis]